MKISKNLKNIDFYINDGWINFNDYIENSKVSNSKKDLYNENLQRLIYYNEHIVSNKIKIKNKEFNLIIEFRYENIKNLRVKILDGISNFSNLNEIELIKMGNYTSLFNFFTYDPSNLKKIIDKINKLNLTSFKDDVHLIISNEIFDEINYNNWYEKFLIKKFLMAKIQLNLQHFL